LKILHVIDKLTMDGVNPSSCTVLLGDWAQALRDADCTFSVLALAREEAAAGYLRARAVDVRFAGCGKHSWGNVKAVREAATAIGADLVHLHGYGAAHFGRIASRQARIPNVVHEHAILRKQSLHMLLDWLLRSKTDVAVAVSEAVRDFMIDVRKVPAARVKVVGNGVDLARFRPATPHCRAEARAMLGLSADVPIVGTVTRFRVEKGNEYLLRAFAHILLAFPSARLVILGDGPLAADLHGIADQLGVSKSIDWLGHRGDVERVLPAFDVQVIPSLTEGFPLALVEGMAVGNPLVVTAVGGMIELADDHQNVLMVSPADAPAIASATIALLSDRARAQRLGKAAAVTAQSLSIAASASRLRRLYEELLTQGP